MAFQIEVPNPKRGDESMAGSLAKEWMGMAFEVEFKDRRSTPFQLAIACFIEVEWILG
ncbi:hypothetical protein PISMIDRAFT_15078 [Pisolithus microcarpus 441]|uniref:Uncharacterized protein n=1 Tax=Pisolithus microcarpus 441 TaxID=765257 RepID=A0A0C9Z4S8_9AGAM|nr:hypothetical protein PISMIDRAFT_15078 [Pisolithus microcarpus 441]